MSDWDHLDDDLQAALLAALNRSPHTVHLGELSDELEISHNDAVEVVEELISLRLGDSDQSAAGELTLTRKGTRAAQAIARSRTSGAARNDEIQQKFMQWLEPYNSQIQFRRFLDSDPAVHGRSISEDELRWAVEFLEGRGLVQGYKTRQMGLIRAALTPEGRNYLSSGKSVSRYLEKAIQYRVNDNRTSIHSHGDFSPVQVGGTGNTQQVSQSFVWPDRETFVDEIDELAEQLEEASETRRMLEALKEEARRPTPDTPRMKRLMYDIASEAMGSAIAGKLLALGPLLPSLG